MKSFPPSSINIGFDLIKVSGAEVFSILVVKKRKNRSSEKLKN